MQVPPIPIDEVSRVKSLIKLDVLDTDPEERFDRVTRITQRLFDVPIALISLVDEKRQWFKSCQGLMVNETSREISFCGHAIANAVTATHENRIFEVPNADLDGRFKDNPLVTGEPNIRYYAGFTLRSHDNFNLGTLCIIDTKPRLLSSNNRKLFIDMAFIAQDILQSLRHEDKDLQTGIYNRRGFLSTAEFMMANCLKIQCSATLVYFDLQNYESLVKFNDSSYELKMLKLFTDILKQTFRDGDVLARIDKSRFVALTTHNKKIKANTFFERVKNQIHYLMTSADEKLCLEFRSGAITTVPEILKNSGRLIDLIDKKMADHEYSYFYEL